MCNSCNTIYISVAYSSDTYYIVNLFTLCLMLSLNYFSANHKMTNKTKSTSPEGNAY